MNSLGVIKVSHEMMDSLELLTPWKEGLDFSKVKEIIQRSPYKIDSFVFLSTCNRVEVIYKIHDPQNHKAFYHYILENFPKIPIQPEHITGRPVALHLLKLAAGLESMVLGETEIRYQLKEAVKQSFQNQLLDSVMNQFWQSIFRESKEIRKHIPSNIPLSISSLSIRNLEEKLGGFAAKEELFVVIGSGPISKASVEYIKKWNGSNVIWVNRTLEKIQEEAVRLNVDTIGLDVFLDQERFQKIYSQPICAIVTATSATYPILTKEIVSKIKKQKLVIMDLAIPSDVEEEVKTLSNVTVVDLQSIKEQLEKNKKRREEAAKNALEVLEDSFYRVETVWITSMSSPMIKEIQEKVHYHSRKRLENLFQGHLQHLSNRDKRILYDWAIRFHREMNRIHRVGIEKILKYYYTISQK
ncbi:MAG: hypothetical protein NZ853_04915 [Leptospiraceae bacterium]|nr:hypothetical protein [Leptospiraceae bacterium]MDW7976712.1 hypothetical protein [Leptospiraceae bacterium]